MFLSFQQIPVYIKKHKKIILTVLEKKYFQDLILKPSFLRFSSYCSTSAELRTVVEMTFGKNITWNCVT